MNFEYRQVNDVKLSENHLNELLKRVKEIRISEHRFYRKVADIHAECSYDYDKNSEITRFFYASVQNKLIYAITGCTAAKVILERADSTKTNMGLITWKNSPEGNIIQRDVTVAKNYLSNEELLELTDLVNMYLDYVENQVKKRGKTLMKEWMKKLDNFLEFHDYEILENPGKIPKSFADKEAKKEFKKFKKHKLILEAC